MEAPDECGHRHEIENKVKSIELIDSQVVKYVKEQLDQMGEDYRILVLPDHPTPLKLRTHTRDAVPYIIYDSSEKLSSGIDCYTEANAAKTGNVIEKGYTIMDKFIKG